MKKSKVALLNISFLSLGVMSLVFGLINIDNLAYNAYEKIYEISFTNKINKPDIPNGDFHIITSDNNTLTFEIINGETFEDGFITLNPQGQFLNPILNEEKTYKNKIGGLKSLKVDYFGPLKLVVKYGWSNNLTFDAEFSSNFTYDFNDELPSYFAIINDSNEKAFINSITIKYDCKETSEIDLNLDKYYPKQFVDTPYNLNVPTLRNRLTFDNDTNTGTLFAPNVYKTSGWYDVNKNFYNDFKHCWAASSSNLIAWYLDQCALLGIDLTNVTRDVNLIFDNYRNNFDSQFAYDPLQGLAWYFTGMTLNGALPDELINKNAGGFLKDLPNVGDTWSIIDPVNHFPIVGNYQNKYPFIDDNIQLGNSIEKFSKNILGQLHYGPTSLMITKDGSTASSGSHAITLWGADFDITTGNINKVYVTDSDDEGYFQGSYLKEVKIKPVYGDEYIGAKMVDYYLPSGDPSPYKFITASTNLFSPKVVSFKS